MVLVNILHSSKCHFITGILVKSQFFTLHEWSNGEEYLESRFGGLEAALAAIEHISSAEARNS